MRVVNDWTYQCKCFLMIVVIALLALPAYASSNWPSFRGTGARGVVEVAKTPVKWNVQTGENIRWKTPIPGLAHSSPIVWGDRLFVTTAVSTDSDPLLRVGLYGESPEHPEKLIHEFKVYCLDRATGKVLWHHTAHSGIPKVKRHIKSTHANCTPATDGKHVVAFFGSEGLYCYDFSGKLQWKNDLGLLDAGAFNSKEIQWAFGSSPIIHEDLAIVQCDVNNQSFVAAYHMKSGELAWKVLRDSLPAWATPTVHKGKNRTQLILNGTHDIVSYNPATGDQFWKFTGNSLIATPTPFVAHDLVFIAAGYRPIKPIYAIRIDAMGDISLKEGTKSNEYVAWSELRRGPYMPTPIVYGDHLFVAQDNGILSCYEAETGKKVYRKRIAGSAAGAYTASPVAAGGKLYFTSEDGDIHVLEASSEYKLLATNSMGEVCLATPAIAGDTLFIRTQHHVFAIAE